MLNNNNKNNFKNYSEKGFSLIELIIVVVIIGIISSIAIPNLMKARRAANESSAVSSISIIYRSELTYKSTTGEGDFTTIDELYNLAFVDEVIGTVPNIKSGYRFEIDIFPSTSTVAARMNVRGRPVVHAASGSITATGGRDFGVTETGGIFKTDDNTPVTFDDVTRVPQGTATPIDGN